MISIGGGCRIVVLGSVVVSIVSSCYLSSESTLSQEIDADRVVEGKDGGSRSNDAGNIERNIDVDRTSEEEDCRGTATRASGRICLGLRIK